MAVKMRPALAAATMLAGLAMTAPAAAATFVFTGGLSSPTSGFTVVNTFDDISTVSGSGFQIKTPPADSDGAPPANSSPSGTAYLSVLAGGTATYLFAGPVSSFQFDWGSVDSYNTLSFVSNQSGMTVIPGLSFANAADGNQTAAGTNGLFTVTGAAGEVFTSVTFTSSSNSFEVDNLAVISAIPEPATWGMMMIGFGMIGATARYRRRRSNIAFA